MGLDRATPPSWDYNAPMCPAYALRDDMTDWSLDLRTVCRKAKTLTLDANSKTGLKEIDVVYPANLINPKHNDLLYAQEPNKAYSDVDNVAKDLLQTVYDYFLKTWDSNKPHVIMHSCGKDSRIMSLTLKKLERDLGKDWLGDVIFIHHLEGNTGDLFKKVMKSGGWAFDQWHINNVDRAKGLDYFNYADFQGNVNAFYNPTFKWWSEIIPVEDEKDWVAVFGSEGNWIGKRGCHTWDQYVRFYPYYSEHYASWHDFLCPYTAYDMLRLNFQIPVHLKNHSQLPVSIRSRACQLLGDKLPYHVHHSYNFKLSKERKEYIQKQYLTSKLYNDYYDVPMVRLAEPWKETAMYTHSQAMNVYGLATMYEGV